MRNPRLDTLTRQAVNAAGKRVSPGTIRKWSVVVGGREFPVKQIVREAANLLVIKSPRVTPADFIAHDAVRILKRLGFEVRYTE
ncbi:MAG: hypothetical protein U1B94_09530 [candidate division NC10 bacterium]|jgi:hypothetical protein|nr:hypothetical protein [candidate division NC10 bacterium]